MNKCLFIGRTTRPAELAYTAGGKAYARFTLAVNDGAYTNKDGEKVEVVDFLDFTAWEATAEFVAKYWGEKQGKPMAVEAIAKLDKWETAEGENRSKVTFKVVKVEFLPSNGKNNETEDDEDETPKKTTKKTETKKAGGFRPKPRQNDDDEDGITDGVV